MAVSKRGMGARAQTWHQRQQPTIAENQVHDEL